MEPTVSGTHPLDFRRSNRSDRIRFARRRLVPLSLILGLLGCLSACGSTDIVASPTPSPSPSDAEQVARTAPGDFGPTGSMTARYFDTATLLKDGRVLVVGGCCGAPDVTFSPPPGLMRALATAEIYDPATGKFSPTASMKAGRYFHTATLLPDGRVLIAGGFNETGPLATAELYDPSTGTFTPTGSMARPRSQHTATLLRDGRVLAAGGTPGTNTAELYSEASGQWVSTGKMTASRWGDTATLLSDGTVLLVGGETSQYSAELYDPATGAFTVATATPTATPTPSQSPPPPTSTTLKTNAPRFFHTATLLANGQVLVAGGSPGRTSSELYDPATRVFTPTGSMNYGRYYFTAVRLPNGNVLVAGGWPSDPSAELYDPKTGDYAITGSMKVGRSRGTATLLNDGGVLLAGGAGGFNGKEQAEIFRP